jgi:hypothetical protein
MEWWKYGILGMKSGPPLADQFLINAISYKDRYHSTKPSIPAFHFSTIPAHWISSIRLRQNDIIKMSSY